MQNFAPVRYINNIKFIIICCMLNIIIIQLTLNNHENNVLGNYKLHEYYN